MPIPGQRVGEYVLSELIGRGTFGEVWRGCHVAWSDRAVAVKIPTDPDYIRYLRREGCAIHGLKHPNIVRAVNFDPYADPPYLILEYIPGWSLRQLLSARRLSIDEALAVLKQVLAGLSHAHRHGYIHRDLKPENILIHQLAASRGLACPGVVKITDFGLSRATGSELPADSIVMSRSQASQANTAGTPAYMAPEQLSGDGHDQRVDLYACGVILFEMLTGERPAGAEVPSSLNPQIPPWLDDLFRRCCTRVERRFGSAEEMLAFMEAARVGPVGHAASPIACQAQPRHIGSLTPSTAPVLPTVTDQYQGALPQPARLPADVDLRRYEGVRGWLRFLCISLTIISPLFTLLTLTSELDAAQRWGGKVPGVNLLVSLEILIWVPLVVFSIYVGAGLWARRPSAVAAAKVFFALAVCANGLFVVIPSVVGLPSDVVPSVMAQSCGAFISSTIGNGLWFAYLCKSKRVKATYFRPR